jgi:hypothetical protein
MVADNTTIVKLLDRASVSGSGRVWPPRPEDWAEAAALCGELGLQKLLDRMLAGLLQIVADCCR